MAQLPPCSRKRKPKTASLAMQPLRNLTSSAKLSSVKTSTHGALLLPPIYYEGFAKLREETMITTLSLWRDLGLCRATLQ